MPLREAELQMIRRRRTYRAAIWVFRVTLCVLLLQLVLDGGDVMHSASLLVWIWLVLAMISIAVLLESAGLPWVGGSEGNFWRIRKMVLKDVFGVGGR